MNFNQATTQIGQTTLRNVLGQSELDELLAERKKINGDLHVIIDEQTERWGVKVTAVEIKDVELPAALQLRYLQTLTEIAVEKNSTIIFPLPIDLVAPLMQIMQCQASVPVHEPLNGTYTKELSLPC